MSTTKETTSSECALLQLPDESLLGILMACDPEDALRMEQTCKILHLLSDSKHLWLTLLAKLDYDQAPDVGPHVDLDSLQAKEVKRIVARALISYNNWCSPDGPRASREQKVLLESHQYAAVMVLPGCQYLIAQAHSSDYFGVWDIARKTLFVRYLTHTRLDLTVRDCALLKGGKISRVAFLRYGNPERIDVVDFDLDRGHAKLLHSELVPITTNAYGLKVREEAVLILSNYNVSLLSPETGKIARVTIGTFDVDLDIVRGTLICVFPEFNGAVRLFVAKLSRIFEHTQGTESILLMDICEICRVLTFMPPPNPRDREYTLTVCDPLAWGSARPCRILLAHTAFHSSKNQGNIVVRVHRLYLEGSHNGSEFVLTYNSSSNLVPLSMEPSDKPFMVTRPSIAGRWMLSGEDGKGKYDIMVCRLWEDDVRFSLSDNILNVSLEETERYSGTQIWYLEDGNCVLHFFD